MPRTFFWLCLISVVLSLNVSLAVQIISAEYFIDNDPGIGLASPITLSPSESVELLKPVSTQGLSPGFHSIGIRFQDSTQAWTETCVRYFFIQQPHVDHGEIVAARYSIDDGTMIPIPVVSGREVTSSEIISTDSLMPGFHKVAVSYQDSFGTWTTAKTSQFLILQPQVDRGEIVAAKYSIDDGDQIPISLSSGREVSFSEAVSTNSFSPGFHKAAVSYQDGSGDWTLPQSKPFRILSNSPVVSRFTGAEAIIHGTLLDGESFDTTFALHAEDGTFDSTDEATSDGVLSGYVHRNGNLPRGDYVLHIRFQNDLGNWSNTLTANFIVTSGLVIIPCQPSTNDVTLHWFTSNLDVGYYSIYIADSSIGIFNFLDSTNIGMYVHTDILTQSLRKFYRITAKYLGARILVTESGVIPLDPAYESKETKVSLETKKTLK